MPSHTRNTKPNRTRPAQTRHLCPPHGHPTRQPRDTRNDETNPRSPMFCNKKQGENETQQPACTPPRPGASRSAGGPAAQTAPARSPNPVILMGVSVLLKQCCWRVALGWAWPRLRRWSRPCPSNWTAISATLKEKADPAPYYIAYEVTETGVRLRLRPLWEPSPPRATSEAAIWTSPSAWALPSWTATIACPATAPTLPPAFHWRSKHSPAAIQRTIWLETDRIYRLAAERLIKVRNARQHERQGRGRFRRLLERTSGGLFRTGGPAELRGG